MSRVTEGFSWLVIFPYVYIAYFLGNMVGESARTPQTAAILFWVYLAVYPVAVIVFNLITRKLRKAGKRPEALFVSLVPYGVLAAIWASFGAFVSVLGRVG